MTTAPTSNQSQSKAFTAACDLIHLAVEHKATELDLSGLELRVLPTELYLLSSQLTSLDLSGCKLLTNLSGIEQLTALTKLDVSFCEALASLAGIEQLTALTKLDASFCKALTSLEGIGQLTALTELEVSWCEALTRLAGIEHLKALAELNVSGCEALTSLAGIEQLTALTKLDVSWCQSLTSLVGIEQLKALTKLDVSGCIALKSLAGIGHLTALSKLDVRMCDALTSLAGIEHLAVLTMLDVSGCTALTSLAGIEQLTALTKLNVSVCEALTSLAGIERLSAVTELNVSRCEALTDLAGIGQLTALTKLDVSWCEALASLVGIEQLTALTELNVSGYKTLTRLVDFGRLTALTKLNVSECESLKSLAGIETLTALVSLKVSKCRFLSSLTGIEQLLNLRYLDARLTSINDIEPLKQLCEVSTKLKTVYLRKTPLENTYNFQFAANENNLPALKSFFYQQGTTPVTILLPVKVLLLGNHAVGKSTLATLLDKDIHYSGSTHILQVHRYGSIHQPASVLKALNLPAAMLYDFGGQDYYHGIYRIFMGQNSIRCLLWKKASDSNHYADDLDQQPNLYFDRQYWLGCLQHFDRNNKVGATTDDSPRNPLLLLQTHVDDGVYEPTQFTQARVDDLSKAANQVTRQVFWQHHFSLCEPNLEADTSNVQVSRGLQNPLFDAAFINFKAQLDYLIRQQQIEIAQAAWYGKFLQLVLRSHNTQLFVTTPTAELLPKYKAPGDPDPEHSKLEAALTQLHRQGLVLYYPQIVANQVWLNPMAFAKHVHEKVLGKKLVTELKGQIPQRRFEQQRIDPEILKILQQEKVVFLHQFGGADGNEPEYIVPNYLPLTNPNSADYQLYTFALAAQPALTLWFEQYLPLGLINQLICHFGQLPDHKKFWRDQILFTLDKQSNSVGSLVLIKLEFAPKLQLKIYLQNSDQQQKPHHIGYLYYVLMALYHDATQLESVDEYKRSLEAFRKNGRVDENHKVPTAKLKNGQVDIFELDKDSDSELYAEQQERVAALSELYKKIYQAPPADLRLSVGGSCFVWATQLTKLEQKTMLSAVDVNADKPSDTLVEASLFAPFMLQTPKKRLKVFVSYAHEDLAYRQKLQQCLNPLIRENKIELWHDSMIDAGSCWDQEIKRKLEAADVAIVLISSSLLASNYVNNEEMPALLARHKSNLVDMVPVLLEACMYECWQANHLQFLPVCGRSEDFQTTQQGASAGLLPIEEWQFPAQAWKQLGEAIQARCDRS
ncbi:hypothetical protein A5320_03665 [Rheinheimera sp. SA_1]|uniref:TIR domain-containing protein n=1 Tax=Rheinheimera sp. SA_1 TaxID=1827365 RepID=UPI00080044A5|nr:TIR domain-containing protein [Rheinheimera sp. SA_1]OBP16513.1 hypothetical protein A5320_03665 [Rheinheimera sp. SA_1]